MSKHNRERREFRKLMKRGVPLTAYQRTRMSKHGKRKLDRATVT